MLTPAATSKINTLLVTIKTQQNFLTRTIETKTKELETAQNKGDVKRAITLSTDSEKQKMNLVILGKINDLLKAYLQDGNTQTLLEGNQKLQHDHKDYGMKWSITTSIVSLFQSDPTTDIYANFKAFVTTEAKPLIDAERARQEYEKAELQAYFNTSQGKEMANTISFLRRG